MPVRDFDPDDLRRNLPRCIEMLDELLRQGHTVYMHCSMGINRSPSVVIAYLHWVQGWDLERAAEHVLERRSCDPYLEAIRKPILGRRLELEKFGAGVSPSRSRSLRTTARNR